MQVQSRPISLVILLSTLLLSGGCAHISHITQLVVEHRPTDSTVSGRAPGNGQYLLWEVRSEGNEHQLNECAVRENEPIGFDSTGGALTAVAGTGRYSLPPGHYRWYRRVPPGETVAKATALTILFPIMLGAGMGGAP